MLSAVLAVVTRGLSSDIIERAIQINPHPPAWYRRAAGITRFVNGDYAGAAAEFALWSRARAIPGRAALWLDAALAQAGDSKAARETLDALRETHSCETCVSLERASYHARLRRTGHRELYLAGLRKAGIRTMNAPGL